jgi:phenylacetate-CoA ligase
MSDLAALPLTTKQDLRNSYPFDLLAVPKERLATYHESSGTSGEPTASYFTEQDWFDVADRFARSAVGLNSADTLMVKTPYSMVTTAHQAHRAAYLKGATVVPADNRSSIMPYMKVVRLLHDLGVTVAWCLPSECLLWAAAARHGGYRTEADFPDLRAFLVAGEPLSCAKRVRIQEIWGGAQVVEDYGSTETGSLAGECPKGNLHLWADRFVVEVYDVETGTSAQEGFGQLVVTSLHREAMPLIRYNLGDLVEVTYSPCDCGWHLPTVRVLGRASAQLTVGRKSISASQLEELVFRLPKAFEVMFWRARLTSSKLEVELEVPPQNESLARSELEEAITTHLRVRSDVRGVPPGTLAPEAILTAQQDFLKPRNLFQENEDWAKAVIYY